MKYKADQVWTGNPLNAARTTDYNYTPDKLNRQSVTDNGVTSNYSVNGLNQYGAIAGQALQYDDRFNLIGYNGGTYAYDSANYLVSANNGSVQFIYDGLGRCVKRTVNGITSLFVFDGWKPMLEFDGTGNPQVWNIYGAGPDEILLRVTNSLLVRYHSDRHGNVAFILDANGYGAERYTYDAFGKPTITDWNGNVRTTSVFGNRFMFQGREYLQELGIYDYRNRMYLPSIGRFLQTDPKGFDAGDMNLFRYCGDDPVDKNDPMGLAAVPHMGYYDQPLFLADYFRPQAGALTMGLTIIISGLGPGQRENSNPGWSNRQFYDAAKATDPNNSKLFRRDQKQEMMKAIADARAKGDYVLNIFGYSRGAVASVQLAQRLDRLGIRMDRLVTVDPVRVLPFGDSAGDFKVPGNVTRAISYYQQGSRESPFDFPGTPLTGNVTNLPLVGRAPISGRIITHQRMPSVVTEIPGGYND